VCHAATAIHVADDGIRAMIAERRIGLGQIAALVGVPTSFELDEAAQEETSFWRAYRLWGDQFEFRIIETFPGHLYPDVREPA
jgi:hypothetical protein